MMLVISLPVSSKSMYLTVPKQALNIVLEKESIMDQASILSDLFLSLQAEIKAVAPTEFAPAEPIFGPEPDVRVLFTIDDELKALYVLLERAKAEVSSLYGPSKRLHMEMAEPNNAKKIADIVRRSKEAQMAGRELESEFFSQEFDDVRVMIQSSIDLMIKLAKANRRRVLLKYLFWASVRQSLLKTGACDHLINQGLAIVSGWRIVIDGDALANDVAGDDLVREFE